MLVYKPYRRHKSPGEPLSWDIKYTREGKVLQLSPFIAETVRDGPTVTVGH